MGYCAKHSYSWTLNENACPSCEREAKPISYGKDRNGGVRAIYIHGVEVVGAVLSSEAIDLVERVQAMLRVYDAEIQHGLASVRLLGDERDTLRARVAELEAERDRIEAETVAAIVAWLRDVNAQGPVHRSTVALSDAIERGEWRKGGA